MTRRILSLRAILFQACDTFFWRIPLFGWCIGNWQLCISKINKKIKKPWLRPLRENVPTAYNSKGLTALGNVGTETLLWMVWMCNTFPHLEAALLDTHLHIEFASSSPPLPSKTTSKDKNTPTYINLASLDVISPEPSESEHSKQTHTPVCELSLGLRDSEVKLNLDEASFCFVLFTILWGDGISISRYVMDVQGVSKRVMHL